MDILNNVKTMNGAHHELCKITQYLLNNRGFTHF